MTVVFASHTSMDSTFVVGSHHYARELCVRGARVLHLSSPVSPAHLLRAAARRGAPARPGVSAHDGVLNVIPFTFVPTVSTAAWGRNVALDTAVPPLRKRLYRLGFSKPDILFIDQPTLAGVWNYMSPGTVIYRPTDTYLADPYRSAQARVLARADAVVCTSAVVLDAISSTAPQRRLVIPNGVEFARFEREPRREWLGDAVYVGALDARFDWSWLRAFALAAPGLAITVAGPTSHSRPSMPANCRILGAVEYDEIPALLKGHTVGLLPLSSDTVNRGRSPMKLFEYLAAGLHVVGTPQLQLPAGSVPGVRLIADPAAAAAAAVLATRGPRNSQGVITAAGRDWSALADELLAFALPGVAHD